MPKRRPMDFLRRLGHRMRVRRLHLGRTRGVVANAAEISVQQLMMYETGQGHPPAATLSRIARSLGMSSSGLLGETLADDAQQQLDTLVEFHADPVVGAVLRHMQGMPVEQRKLLQFIAANLAAKCEAARVDRAEVMT